MKVIKDRGVILLGAIGLVILGNLAVAIADNSALLGWQIGVSGAWLVAFVVALVLAVKRPLTDA